MEQLTKHGNVLLLPQKIPQKTPSKKIRIRTRQCRIPQDQPYTRTAKPTQTQNQNRIPTALQPRTQPNRNMLENHKKKRNQLNILPHNRTPANSNRTTPKQQ